MTDLKGASLTETFSSSGATADPHAPYTNSGAEATLTLNNTNVAGVVTEANGTIADGAGKIDLHLEGSGDFDFLGADLFTGSVFVSGTPTIDVATTGALGSGGIEIFSGATPTFISLGTFTTAQNIQIDAGDSAAFAAAAGDSFTETGKFSDLGGAGATLHIGSTALTGTVTLSASSQSTDADGALSVDGGTLKIASAAAAQAISTLTGGVTVNGTLDVHGNNVTLDDLTGSGAVENSGAAATLTIDDASAETFAGSISGPLSLDVTADGPVVLTGQTAVTQATIGSGGHLKIGDNTSGASFSGNVLDNGEFEFNVVGAFAYAGQISGSGIVRLTSGTGTFTGDNSSFQGEFDFGSGELSISNAAATGTAKLVMGAGTLEAGGNVSLTNSVIFGGDARLEATAGNTLTLAGALTDTGAGLSGSQIHIGSAADTGTVLLGNNGGDGFAISGAGVEIDGGTLNVQSDLSLGGVSVTFAGANGKLILNGTSAAVAVGNNGASGEVDLNSAEVDLTGGADTIKFASGSNDAATISGTSGHTDNVTGSNGAVTLDNAQANVTGGADTINLDGNADDALSLISTAGQVDNVNGSNGKLGLNAAQANLTGGSDTVFFDANVSDALSLFGTNGHTDTIYASNGKIGLDNAQANLVGGGATVFFDGNVKDALSLINTGGQTDSVYATDGLLGLNNAQANLVGGGDTAFFDGNVNDALSLINTSGQTDTVNGSNGKLGLNDAQANLVGGGDTVFLDGNVNDALSLINTGGHADIIYGSNGTFGLNSAQAALVGGGDTVFFDGNTSDSLSIQQTNGAADVIHASNGTLGLTSAQATLTGSNDTVFFAGADTLTISGVSNNFFFGAPIGQTTMTGFDFSDVLHFSAADWSSFSALQGSGDLQQSGNNTIITLDASDKVTLIGVTAKNLTSAQFSFA